MQNKQSGFAVVETVLVFVILAIIAGTGYYVWSSQKNANASLDSANKTSQSKATVSQKPTAQSGTKAADEKTAIVAAVKSYKDNQNQPADDPLTVTIDHSNATFADGSISSQGGAAGVWFAHKTDGKWTVLSQGQDSHCTELKHFGLSEWYQAEHCTAMDS